jgi:hypothetical protein
MGWICDDPLWDGETKEANIHRMARSGRKRNGAFQQKFWKADVHSSAWMDSLGTLGRKPFARF